MLFKTILVCFTCLYGTVAAASCVTSDPENTIYLKQKDAWLTLTKLNRTHELDDKSSAITNLQYKTENTKYKNGVLSVRVTITKTKKFKGEERVRIYRQDYDPVCDSESVRSRFYEELDENISKIDYDLYHRYAKRFTGELEHRACIENRIRISIGVLV